MSGGGSIGFYGTSDSGHGPALENPNVHAADNAAVANIIDV